MGILESPCTFQMLSIKRLDALSKSQVSKKLTIAPAALFKQNFIKKFACSEIFI